MMLDSIPFILKKYLDAALLESSFLGLKSAMRAYANEPLVPAEASPLPPRLVVAPQSRSLFVAGLSSKFAVNTQFGMKFQKISG